jgi:hypothetical protein
MTPDAASGPGDLRAAALAARAGRARAAAVRARAETRRAVLARRPPPAGALAAACADAWTFYRDSLAGSWVITVDELTQDQALDLLGQWAGEAAAAAPGDARAVCTRVGNLALGVAMAGAMVRGGRPLADVLGLIELGLDRVRADPGTAYPYKTLYVPPRAACKKKQTRSRTRKNAPASPPDRGS